MKRILTILMVSLSFTLFSQNLDTVEVEKPTINLHLDKVDLGESKDYTFILRSTTPYLYVSDKNNSPFENEPVPYPRNFNPYGAEVVFVGGVKIFLFR